MSTAKQDASTIITQHHRDNIRGCGCGWAEIGRSHSDHVAQELINAGLIDAEQERPAGRKAKPPVSGTWFAPSSGGYRGLGPDGEAVTVKGKPPRGPAPTRHLPRGAA